MRRLFPGWREVSYLEDPDSPFTPYETQEERAFHAVAAIVWRGEPDSSPDEELTLSQGPLLDGVAVEAPDGALFWYKDDTVHAANDAARQIAPHLPRAPDEVTEQAVRDAAQESTCQMTFFDVEGVSFEVERKSPLAAVRECLKAHFARDAREARAVLRRMRAAYRRCRTYVDGGRLMASYRDSDGESDNDYVFWTAYDRGGFFHYEWGTPGEEENAQNILGCIHQDKSGVRFWDVHSDEVTDLRSLTGAIHRAVDKHWSLAVTVIPPLLERMRLNRHWVPPMGVVRAPKTLPDVDLDGVPCHRVQGLGWGGTTVLWIDKTNYALRGIDEVSDPGEYQSTTRIRFLPELNKPLPSEAFTRVPPDTAQPGQ